MTEPSSVDPERTREAVVRSFRRRDDGELQADLTALAQRRSDLALVRCTELFGAAIARLQDRYDVRERVPSAAAIGAWVDAVVPPDPAAAIPPAAGAVPYPPDPSAITLLTDPGSTVIARGLLALAGQRPDLSDLQRHELFLAGLVHLVVRTDGFIIHPRRQGIFAWIDLVAPERSSGVLPPVARGPVHDGPAVNPSLEGSPTPQAGTAAQRPCVLPGGLTWDEIDRAYRRLAAAVPDVRHRRRRPGEPSRPEIAAELHVSPSTLKRACVAAGDGPRWPPARLRRSGTA